MDRHKEQHSSVVRYLQVPTERFALRQPIRLNPGTYRMGYAFSVTITAFCRRPVFRDARAAELGIACLREVAARFTAQVFAYTFMPDHVHVLASTPADRDFDEFIRQFKQAAGYRLRRELGLNRVWQPRYFDRALRGPDSLVTVAEYIWGNPVRAGLVASVGEFPFSGSFEWQGALGSGSQDPGLRA